MTLTQMPPNVYLFDGVKAVRIDDLPASAWSWYSKHLSEDEAEVQERWVKVPWLNRGVNLRASSVSSLPFALVDPAGDEYDVSSDWQNKVGFLPNPQRLLYLLESSLTLVGQGYLFKSRNRVKLLDLRYLVASTVTPQYSEETGLLGFNRQLGQKAMRLDPEDLVYLWALDPFVEIGPGNNSPATAALSAANVLYNVNEFASSFFKRGAIKVTILLLKGSPPEAERKRIRDWWRRTFTGVSNAWQSEVAQAEALEPVTIGEGIKELSDTELTKEKREDISVALGIPMTILWSSTASGLGGGGVVQSDERKFYEQTIVPEARFIESVLNEQVFEPMNLRWQFRPETLDVFQADEQSRAQALVYYTQAGFRLSVACQILGIELPPGMKYEDLDAAQQEDKEAGAARFQAVQETMQQGGGQGEDEERERQNQELRQKAMLDDLDKWERKVENKGKDCSFESEFIEPWLIEQTKALLVHAESEPEIEGAFAIARREVKQWGQFVPDGEEVTAATAAPFCSRETREPWGWDYEYP